MRDVAKGTAKPNRRASPEAVEKRRAARAFNDLLADGSPTSDGRTEKRRRRLLEELSRGKKRSSGRELKPVEVLSHVHELLELGEPLATLRKACPPRKALAPRELLADGVRRIHDAYGFRPEAYRFVGVDDETLVAAGVVAPPRRRRGEARGDGGPGHPAGAVKA